MSPVTVRVRPAAPVRRQPVARLREWRVYAVDESTWHLVGRCPETGGYRVTTPLRRLDRRRRTAVTASARHYRLLGDPGAPGGLTAAVWHLWCERTWGERRGRDVTAAVLRGGRH